jgi:hypothetical protein
MQPKLLSYLLEKLAEISLTAAEEPSQVCAICYFLCSTQCCGSGMFYSGSENFFHPGSYEVWRKPIRTAILSLQKSVLERMREKQN